MAAQVAEGKKAERIRVLDVNSVSNITDYFVIASVNNRIQLRAIADETMDRFREQGVHVHHLEGYDKSSWILLDCGDVVVNYFLNEARDFYGLERLWGDAPCMDF